MFEIIKITLKLLVRNKGFWFFLVATPILSTIILGIEQTNLGAYEMMGETEIVELDDMDSKVAYYGGKGKCVIKVYDASDSELSDYVLNKLLSSGAFIVCRVKVPGMTREEVEERNHYDGYEDRMGASIYLGEDFDKEALAGDVNDSLTVYVLSDDERYKLLENDLKLSLGQIKNAVQMAGEDNVINTLEAMNDNVPQKQVKHLGGKDQRELTNHQLDQKAIMGYSLAILTMGYVFGGLFIAHTVIKEQKDMVLTRLKLTNLSNTGYYAAKFVSGAVVAGMLSIIISITTLSISEEKIGISRPSFIALIFLMGLIFCSISLLFGILLDNVMSANVAAFTLWSMSSLLSGLYFPLDSTTKAVKIMSCMMPQKWFLDGVEMLMVDDNKVYLVLLCVTVAYLIITLSLGSVGIKYKNYE